MDLADPDEPQHSPDGTSLHTSRTHMSSPPTSESSSELRGRAASSSAAPAMLSANGEHTFPSSDGYLESRRHRESSLDSSMSEVSGFTADDDRSPLPSDRKGLPPRTDSGLSLALKPEVAAALMDRVADKRGNLAALTIQRAWRRKLEARLSARKRLNRAIKSIKSMTGHRHHHRLTHDHPMSATDAEPAWLQHADGRSQDGSSSGRSSASRTPPSASRPAPSGERPRSPRDLVPTRPATAVSRRPTTAPRLSSVPPDAASLSPTAGPAADATRTPEKAAQVYSRRRENAQRTIAATRIQRFWRSHTLYRPKVAKTSRPPASDDDVVADLLNR
eukprot:TRINITY_DN488_c0_g1_i1.p1 TRINITY_DN488_c0_g1~~TRINITY_DN488_c0_g1_i1.p1  ORF type:complete len:333 (-),score=61.20 TRINITY_DN488_c0_g1_i1:828-1826(-)